MSELCEHIHKTWPHGSQDIYLIDDATTGQNRIYLIRDNEKSEDDEYRGIYLTGMEIENLVEFWFRELKRNGRPSSD